MDKKMNPAQLMPRGDAFVLRRMGNRASWSV